MSPIRVRSPSVNETNYVSPNWSPAKNDIMGSDAKTAYMSPSATSANNTSAPKMEKKARRLPTYMTTPDSPVRELVYGISETVLKNLEEFEHVKDQMRSVESEEFYRYYLDADIDSICGVSENIVIGSKKQLLGIHKLMMEFAVLICTKVDKLFADADVSLREMPVHRWEWASYAKDTAEAIVEELTVEMQHVDALE
jgi:hypothetical protein